MKCKNCDGNLTLEDVVCPYCETINEHAIEHIREMNRYKKDYEGTKQEVITTTKAYAGVTVRIMILAVLIVLTVMCGILSGETYSIKRRFTEAFRDNDECRSQMEAYLEDRDYYALAMYCDANYIDVSDAEYEEYDSVIRAADIYMYFYDFCMKMTGTDEESRIQSYTEYMSEQIYDFYRMLNEQDYYLYVKESDAYYEDILRIEEQMQALLVTYCHLSTEEADTLQGLTKAETNLLLQEGVLNE